MLERIGPNTFTRAHFLRTDRRDIRAADGKVLRFQLQYDDYARMHYVTATESNKQIGHFDFDVRAGWMDVNYGAFATAPFSMSYSDWSTACLKTKAIEVEKPWRLDYRGFGQSMVSLALQWGRNQGLSGMRIIRPLTPVFWRKLNFLWEGKNQVFCLATQIAPKTRITMRR